MRPYFNKARWDWLIGISHHIVNTSARWQAPYNNRFHLLDVAHCSKRQSPRGCLDFLGQVWLLWQRLHLCSFVKALFWKEQTCLINPDGMTSRDWVDVWFWQTGFITGTCCGWNTVSPLNKWSQELDWLHVFVLKRKKSEFPLTVLQLLHYKVWYSEFHCFCHQAFLASLKLQNKNMHVW